MPAVSDSEGTKIHNLTFPLVGGTVAILRVPLPLTQENYALIVTILEAMKPAISTGHDETSTKEEPCPKNP